MSLFYAPLVIWSFLQYLDLLLEKLNPFSLIIFFFAVMLIINGLMRLYRVPQRHIGMFSSEHILALVDTSKYFYPIQSSP